ncbi:putative pectinesterase/pectinesterase inhibitor 51 [Hibiscus syriacus]|uniref:pectinesterase n=1 Tax=Hibiscus syriacus TaxID=106335 RepID=A0A6A3BM86_HIBSY|nr:putative pectinesterase/pectinesterase inhibitor 51 [Hibiscus syriacus]
MAINIVFLVCLIFFAVVSSAGVVHHGNAHVYVSRSSPIRHACQATRFPQLCETSLVLPPNPTTIQIIQSAISVSKDHLKKAQSMVADVSDSVTANVNHTSVVLFCVEMISFSEYRMELVRAALTKGKMKDARAWMSAVHGYQRSSWGALKRINDAMPIAHVMSFLDTLAQISSNSLSMLVAYDNYRENTALWTHPKTERDGFYEDRPCRKPELRFKGGGSHEFEGGRNARRFVIRIRSGVYRETVRVPIGKKNVVVWGEGMGKTIITGSLNVHQPGIHTFNSPTVGVLGDGFMARDLTVENTAGSNGHQAVAFRSDSDMSVIENCEFIGNQDTLCSNSLRQLYKNCRIQCNVDFIFGTSASVFQDCLLLIAPRTSNPEKGDNNAITAYGRTDPAESTGFVVHDCVIKGMEEYTRIYNKKVHKNYLGRPWKEYSRTVFIDCDIEKLISPEGWTPWSGDIGLKTLFYGEFRNIGGGSDVSKRVPWSSQIPPQFVHAYSVNNFIQGDQWAPK